MKFSKILYAAALSTDANETFRKALEIAETFDAKLHILHVVEELSPGAKSTLQWVDSEKITQKHYEDFQKYSVEKIRASIHEICDELFKDRPSCRQRIEAITVAIGYPADEILKKIDELGCDALIMGSHSKGAVAHAFLGSTAERVLRRVRKPAIILPA